MLRLADRLRGSVAAIVVGSAFALVGCQALWGFETLEAGSGGSNADGGTTNPASGGNESTGGSGSGNLGVSCDGNDACSAELVCLYGYCRVPCEDDTECENGSVCLFLSAAGGCRLAAETCEDAACANADLVCGLDATCRTACSDDDSCDASTQRCIAGTCVSTIGSDAESWSCGGHDDREVYCDGSALSVCNATLPGVSVIETCGSSALCEESVPSDASFDAESPPECALGCVAGEYSCDGPTLVQCREDGAGTVDDGETCASDGLCELGLELDPVACREPVCEAGDVRCGGGQTETVVEECNAARSGWDLTQECAFTELQCNPGASECVTLDVDETEVTIESYQAFLADNPDTDDQEAGCAWNDSFAPDATCQGELACDEATDDCDAEPRTCVDWCDAFAYCAAQGRRLCGAIGGGPVDFDRYDDAGQSQWMNACTAGGQYDYGMGAAPDTEATHCSYDNTSNGEAYEVGTHSACRSPSPGYNTLFDLSGNVEEWEDACELPVQQASASENDACRTRGGSFETPREETVCASVPTVPRTRSVTAPSLGFRCCG